MKIKYLIISAVLLTVFFGSFGTAGALTTQDLQAQIQALMQQIATLQAQLAQMQGGDTATWCHTFSTNLRIGDSNFQEVYNLQMALSKEGFDIPMNEDENSSFGEATASAVVAFQEKYASDILTPSGLKHGTGFVGGATKKKLNALYGCGAVPPVACTQEAKQCPDGSYVSRVGPNCEFTQCPINSTNKPPVISGVSGPTTLKVGETGKWTITASDPENGYLEYSVDWGGGGASLQPENSALSKLPQTTTFTHSYYEKGNYTITFNVHDNYGNQAQSSVSVNVGGSVANCGQLIYFCSENSPFCNASLNFVVDQYAQSSGCVEVVKHIIPDFTKLNQDPLAVKYGNIVGVPTFVFVDSNGCFGEILNNGKSRTLENLKEGISNFVCSTTQPSFAITSPNGGEQWQIGGTYTIKYSVRNGANKNGVRIYLEKGYDYPTTKTGSNSSLLIATTTDAESYTYTVPGIIQTWPGLGNNYKIKVCDNATCSIQDTSDDYFTITSGATQPSVTASASKAQYISGLDQVSISYDVANAPFEAMIEMDIKASKMIGGVYPLVSLYKLDDATRNFDLSVAQTTFPSHGTITWTSSVYEGFLPIEGPLEIRIKNSSGVLLAKTQVPIKIVSATTTPSITVTSPNGGEIFVKGQAQTIKFSAQGFGNNLVNIYLLNEETNNGYIIGDNASAGNSLKNSFSWVVPADTLLGSKYRIRVCTTDAKVCDSSDNYFTITSTTSSTPFISTISAAPINGFNHIRLTGTNLFSSKLGISKIDGLRNLSSDGTGSGCGGLVSTDGAQVDCDSNMDLTAGTHTFQLVNTDGVSSNIVSFTLSSPWLKPKITNITPSTASVGTQITITGTGFDPVGNFIEFTWWGGYGTNEIGLDSQLVSSSNDGTTITYTIPSLLSTCTNLPGGSTCMYGPTQTLPPHSYGVSVVTANGYSKGSNLAIVTP